MLTAKPIWILLIGMMLAARKVSSTGVMDAKISFVRCPMQTDHKSR